MLWVIRHGPSGNKDDKTRDEVPLWSTIRLSAEPDTGKTGTPPDDTHRSMLDIITAPRFAPSVLCKSIDAAPCSNQGRVEELLRSSGLPQPDLSSQHDDTKDDTVCYEGATHDEMCQTLAQMVIMAEAQRSNPSKQHLHPRYHGHQLSNDSMPVNRNLPDLAMEPLFEMEFEVDAEDNLHGQHEHKDIRKRGVDILRK